MRSCLTKTVDRRKTFWTTKPDACGVERDCSSNCGVPGLAISCRDGGATFDTDGYAVSLALNIILTNGQKEDSFCGHVPGTRGGHWSDSFRTDSKTSGSRFRYVENRGSMRETVSLIQAYIRDDLKKLVDYGVAVSVDVDVTYSSYNSLKMGIVIHGVTGQQSRVGFIGSRIENAWVWRGENELHG